MEINLSIGFISYVSSALFSLFLLIIYFIGIQKGQKGKPYLLLVVATLVWSILLIMSQIGASKAFDLIMVAELLRYYTWFYVLQIASGRQFEQWFKFSLSDPLSPVNISILFLIALIVVLFNESLSKIFLINNPIYIQIALMLLLSVLGLLLVEQLYRNTPQAERWTVNFLCISSGAIFCYDFFVYSNAFLMQNLDYEFWSARGLVNAVMMPLVVLAAVRSPQLAPKIHVSRTFIFHSSTLLATGIYLILMSLAGFYIRQFGGEWGKVLQALFLFAAIVILAFVFFSSSIKTRIKRYLVYSFRNKYDYREEWNRFSQTILLSDSGESIYQRSLKAVAQIVESEGASLWIKNDQEYSLIAEYRELDKLPETEMGSSILIDFIHKNHCLFSQKEFDDYARKNTSEEHWFLQSKNSWLIIPLWIGQNLFGFVQLQKSIVGMDLDIEDQDLLTTVAHHVALSLSLKETDLALQQAQRFEEVNQITAFLVHDLKTVLSQLTLMVENGKVHKNNPAFIDDMFNTVEHVASKMQRLVQQLKSPDQKPIKKTTRIVEVVKGIVSSYQHHEIQPVLEIPDGLNPLLECNEENLTSAIKHIVQNALESCDRNGQVRLQLSSDRPDEALLKVIDTGKGMTREFIKDRLFQPFDSTKGVSGMGVGVYQSREFLRSIQGDLTVYSNPGEGTTFTLRFPLNNDKKTINY